MTFAEKILPGLKELRLQANYGDKDLVIAVIDGPICLGHPGLRRSNVSLIDRGLRAKLVQPRSDHGTHVTSIIFGSENSPVSGIAPRCRGLAIPLYREAADGRLIEGSQSDLALAINLALDRGARIINVSGGMPSQSAGAEMLLEAAVRRCVAQGALLVAAAGNDGGEVVHVPAGLPGVLAVGAADHSGRPLLFSNFGPEVARQGLLAPGENIPGAGVPQGIVYKTGTSFATPIVTGIVSLLASLQRRRGEKIDLQAIRAALLNSAVGRLPGEAVDARRVLRGRIDLPRALNRLFPEPAVPPGRSGRPVLFHPPAEESIMTNNNDDLPEDDDNENVAAAEVKASDADDEAAEAAAELVPAGVRSSSLGGSSGVRPSNTSVPSIPGAPGAQLVFPIGQLYYDFGTEPRRDWFIQQMGGNPGTPFVPQEMAKRLTPDERGEGHASDADSLIWILQMDGVPIYSILPEKQYAMAEYNALRQLLRLSYPNDPKSLDKVERIGIAGTITGSVRLFNGTVVPTIDPTLRGMFAWSTKDLVDAVIKANETAEEKLDISKPEVRTGLADFLSRVYDQMRNSGISPQDRALNFAACNAFQLGRVFGEVARDSMVLDAIKVAKTPIQRPTSDMWDVFITFFKPNKVMEQARKTYRITVDVADEVPVTVGDIRSWYSYFGNQQ